MVMTVMHAGRGLSMEYSRIFYRQLESPISPFDVNRIDACCMNPDDHISRSVELWLRQVRNLILGWFRVR